MVKATAKQWHFEQSLIACCKFGDQDPRGTMPAGFEAHQRRSEDGTLPNFNPSNTFFGG
jgi:hypothetical protein